MYKFLLFVAAFAVVSPAASAQGRKRHSHRVAKADAKVSADPIASIVFDKGLQDGWQDWGWTPRTVESGKVARLHMQNYGGWILAHRDLAGHFSALSFDVKAPAKFGDFLEVRLSSQNDDSFPRINVTAENSKRVEGNWLRVRLKMSDLNPSAAPFDRIFFRAIKGLGDEVVELDKVLLYAGDDKPEPPANPDTFKSHNTVLDVDCGAPSHAISPMIYGMAYNPSQAGQDAFQWNLGATSRRWGGNPASRYNWKLGNAWNTASDWFFMNTNYTNDASYTWKKFLDENRAHHVTTALTVPMLGWVAKDTSAFAFPTAIHGAQQQVQGEMGNGKSTSGKPLVSDPARTSQAVTAEFEGDWVKAIRAYDTASGARNVHEYILDNEPALWNSTHRDVHPQAVTYDELLKKTLDYGSAIRKADPQATIAGPAEWGWPGYFFSGKDAEAGFTYKPDRRAHGDVPLLEWYLRKLREHQQKTGERVLDVVDLHYYPQTDGTYGQNEKNDAVGAINRVRATRSLWDPTYKDDSWINEKIQLLPRMRDLIAANYPGLRMSLGEYNFGGERNISGGLAEAEALGRFGQFDVYSAYYWTYPPANSCTYHAFRAFRNYDGQGGHFLDRSIQAVGDAKTSIFVSQNDTKDALVAVVLNLDGKEVADAKINLGRCGAYKAVRHFAYTGGAAGLQEVGESNPLTGATLHAKLLPFSINVFELKR